MTARPLHVLALIAIAGALLAACGGPAAVAPTAAPTAAAKPTDAPTAAAKPTAESKPTTNSTAPTATGAANAADAKASIQQTLDQLAQAYNENKPDLIAQIVDPANPALRRYWQTRLETFQQSLSAGQVTFAFEVQKTEPLDLGFVKADVITNGGLAEWTFRQVNGAWLIAEPTKEQLGKREKIESEHFTFLVFPWAKSTTEEIIKLMENARERVRAKLGKVPDKKAEVYLNPTYSVASNVSPNTLAFYDAASFTRPTAPDRMVIFSPESYVFGAYDPSVGWQKELEDTLTHEYTHLVNNRLFTPIHRMSVWMSEGLAEYVSDAFRESQVSQAVQADYIIPILDKSGSANPQDLDHLYTLEKASDKSLAYGFGASLVRYIVEKYGSLDAFWKFVQAYDKSQSHDQALQQAFGVSYEQFDKDWRAWLKEKY